MANEPRQRILETAHGRIAVAEAGEGGLPLLLIHGNSSCREVFRHQMRGRIAQGRRVVAFDLPGHGASSDAPDPAMSYTMPGYAEAAVAVLRELGVGEAAVLGWSLGGHVGIEMIPRFPGLRGLMITGTPPCTAATATERASSRRRTWGCAGQEVLSEAEIDAYAHSTCGEPFEPFMRGAVARTDGRARKTMFDAFLADSGIDQRCAVETSPVPLAVVNGADEPFVDLDYVDRIAYANLWEGRCHRLAGLEHAPFWQAPEVFDPILERFLQDIAIGSRDRRPAPMTPVLQTRAECHDA